MSVIEAPRFDRAKSTGFTAVNGETGGSTSFRPLAHDGDNATASRDDPQSEAHSVEPQTNGSTTDTAAPSPVRSSPPVKRQRSSHPRDDETLGRTSPESESDGMTPESVSSGMPMDLDDARPGQQASEGPAQPPQHQQSGDQSRSSEIQTHNPQDIRPETSRELQERLQFHLNSRAEPPLQSLSNGHPPINGQPSGNPATVPGPPKRKREFAHRTKSGCHTCRSRKKKCDEGKPTCVNCQRGNFHCGGYGPANRNINYKRTVSSKVQHNIQAKPLEFSPQQALQQAPHGPQESQWYGPPPPGYPHHDPSRYGPLSHMPPPPLGQPYGPQSHDPRDGWPPRPHYADGHHIHLQNNRLPQVDYAPIHMSSFPSSDSSRPPVSDSYSNLAYRTAVPGPAPYPPHDVSRRNSQFPPMLTERELSEREKMLTGQPYRHWKDRSLIADRLDCKTAVDLYNRAALPSEALSPDERANRFAAVLDPNKRTSRHGDASALGRIGMCGERTIVEAPFHCDYGYNLNIGAETVIHSNCFIQDPCEIRIGNRCTIGPDVKFCGMTFSIDTKVTAGSQGNFLGGAIRVEDDCKIGANVVILAYRVIGRGAVVAAGSVVTRNVKPFTIVAGNPAKEVRTINETTIDRRMRTEIQEENDRMIEDMRRGRAGAVRS